MKDYLMDAIKKLIITSILLTALGAQTYLYAMGNNNSAAAADEDEKEAVGVLEAERTKNETEKRLFHNAFYEGDLVKAYQLIVSQRKDRLALQDAHAIEKIRNTIASLMIADQANKGNNAKAAEIAREIKKEDAITKPDSDADDEIIQKALFSISMNEIKIRTHAIKFCGPEVAQIAMSMELGGGQSHPAKYISYLRDAIDAEEKDTVEMLRHLGADFQQLLRFYVNSGDVKKITSIIHDYKLDPKITHDVLFWLMAQPICYEERESNYRMSMEALVFSGAYLSTDELRKLSENAEQSRRNETYDTTLQKLYDTIRLIDDLADNDSQKNPALPFLPLPLCDLVRDYSIPAPNPIMDEMRKRVGL